MLPGVLRPLPPTPDPDRTWRLPFVGHELHVEEFGDEADPVLVYVHGLLLSSRINRGVAAALAAQGVRVVLVDLLGHGGSSKPTRASYYRFDTFPAQVVALLDALDLERAALGGVSLGANVAVWTAVQHPERVSAMVIEMPVMEYGTTAANAIFLPLLLAAHYAPPVLGAVSRVARALPSSGTWLDGVRDAVAQPPDVMTAVLHGLLVGPTAPTVEQREALLQPALVLAHDHDVLHPFSDSVSLARTLPAGRLLRARSPVELRAHPDRLTREVAELVRATADQGASRSTTQPSAASRR